MSGDTVIEPVKEQMDQVKLFFNNINVFLDIRNFFRRKKIRPSVARNRRKRVKT